MDCFLVWLIHDIVLKSLPSSYSGHLGHGLIILSATGLVPTAESYISSVLRPNRVQWGYRAGVRGPFGSCAWMGDSACPSGWASCRLLLSRKETGGTCPASVEGMNDPSRADRGPADESSLRRLLVRISPHAGPILGQAPRRHPFVSTAEWPAGAQGAGDVERLLYLAKQAKQCPDS